MGGKKRAPTAGIRSSKHHLSMRDEARNTERHYLRTSNAPLRGNRVSFVSAGNLQTEDPAILNKAHDNVLPERDESENIAATISPAQGGDSPQENGGDSNGVVEKGIAGSHSDRLQRDVAAAHELCPEPVVVSSPGISRDHQPDSPSSSEDEVVFAGRGAGTRQLGRMDESSKADLSGPERGALGERGWVSPSLRQPQSSPEDPDSPSFSEDYVSLFPTRSKKRRSRSSRSAARRQDHFSDLEDDSAFADYIENILENPSSEEDPAELETDQAEVGRETPVHTPPVTALEGRLEAHLRGSTSAFMGDTGAMDTVSGDEVPREMPMKRGGFLGLEDESSFSDEDTEAMRPELSTITRSSRRGNRARSRRTAFPSATAFADALEQDPYGAFDIMDFDRPSLRHKPQGKRQNLEFGLSDSELEWQLQVSWESDRKKKKIKKREREELRTQGLLGKKAAKWEATASTNMEEITTAIRDFLLSENLNLSLPPMEKKHRKLVHELANALTLGSASKGSGASRFPILSKTARTVTFDTTTIGRFDRLISGNRFAQRTGKGKSQRRGVAAPKARGATGAASYLDGEIVGASAPEIGVENKGRAMLEKMGWSTGTALGAIHNKGILHPVAHVVKTSKAGLG